MFGIESNLMAHHLDVLEAAGLITRRHSSGDKRRRYVTLDRDALDSIAVMPRLAAQPALFVCSANSARSHLAAALWRSLAGAPAASAGTRPAAGVHPGAAAAALRNGLDLGKDPKPHRLDEVTHPPLVVTVCDQAHEELAGSIDALHWSVPDPVPVGTRRAFEATVEDLRGRISRLVAS